MTPPTSDGDDSEPGALSHGDSPSGNNDGDDNHPSREEEEDSAEDGRDCDNNRKLSELVASMGEFADEVTTIMFAEDDDDYGDHRRPIEYSGVEVTDHRICYGYNPEVRFERERGVSPKEGAEGNDDHDAEKHYYAARFILYPRTRVLSVAVIERQGQGYRLGESTGEEDDEEEKVPYDDLFNTDSLKTVFLIQNATVDLFRLVLSDPLKYSGRSDCDAFCRRDSLAEKWCPVRPREYVGTCCSGCGRECSTSATPADNDDDNRPEKPMFKLKMCTGCRRVAYCGPGCQRRNWSDGRHRHECKRLSNNKGKRERRDVVNRWHHIALASGLLKICEDDGDDDHGDGKQRDPEQVLESISGVCDLFDHLLFEPDEDGLSPDCMCRARYGCGAICCLCEYQFTRCRIVRLVVDVDQPSSFHSVGTTVIVAYVLSLSHQCFTFDSQSAFGHWSGVPRHCRILQHI